MFLKTFFISAFLLVANGNIFAQSKIKEDSLHRTVAPPVTITSDALRPEILLHPTDLHVVTSEDIRMQTGATRLPEALQVLHPSLDIRNYGSLGGISLSSFRGLPSEYTSVYWEGIKITNSQHSLTDLALIDLKSVESIAIISAANSQLIGGDIGSAGILLTTNAGLRQSGINVATSAQSYNDLSSFGEQQLDIGATVKANDNLTLSGGVDLGYSNGSFPFVQQISGKTVDRENNDAHLFNANVAATYTIDESATIKTFSTFAKADRGTPGPVTISGRGASDFGARHKDQNFLTALSFAHSPSDIFYYTLSLGYQSQYETYSDTIQNPLLHIGENYLNRIYSGIWKSKASVSENLDLFGGFDISGSTLYSSANSASGDSAISRSNYAAYLAAKIQFLNSFDATVGFRSELQSDLNLIQYLPSMSVRYLEPISLLQLQASIGRIYHAPTLNELYWKHGGNVNLRYEKGTSIEITAGLPVTLTPVISGQFQLTGFKTLLADQIIWQPQRNTVDWSPVNIPSTRSQGVEITAEMKYHVGRCFFTLKEGMSLQDTKNLTDSSKYFGKELPYSTPLRSVLSLQFQDTSIGNLSLIAVYRGHRYTDYYNNESSKLPAVIKYDITLSSAPVSLASVISGTINFSILNFTNIQYEEIPSYPQPGRSFRFSLDFHFL
ncbi:MAG: TonB-dependent receptor [Ignavibacteriota bacterium]